LRTKGLVVIAVPVVGMLVAAVCLFVVGIQGRHAADSVSHTLEVRTQIHELDANVVEVDAAVRGYLLDGQSQWLTRFERAKASSDELVGHLRSLIADNARQRGRLTHLRPLLDDHLREQAQLLAYLRTLGQPPPRVPDAVTRAQSLTDAVDHELGVMDREEARVLVARRAGEERARRTESAAAAACGLVGLGGGVLVALLFSSGMVRRVQALSANARRLERGEATVPQPDGADDELARLGRTLEEVAALLARREEELRRSETFLRSVVENIPTMVFAKDAAALQFVLFNRAGEDLTGHTRDTLLGKNDYDLFPPEQADFFVAQDRHVLEKGALLDIPEEPLDTSAGERRFLHTRKVPIADAAGRPAFLLGISEDITERKRAEAALQEAKAEAERANRAKSEFLSRMSHELRTPLNAILGFAQLLAMDELGANQRESVDQVLRGGRHLLGLINEVLDISRIETGSLALSAEAVSVAEVVHETLNLVQPLAAAHEVTITAQLSGNYPQTVVADRQRLRQVLLNLLSNGVKYNRPGGSITISCAPGGEDRVRLAVRDTGPGIPPDKMHRLFVPFDRLGADETGVEGTGIGLALSRGLTELMGGTLTAESTPGEGTTFFLELAVGVDPVARYEQREPDLPTTLSPAEHGGTVLYVEDNPSNLQLVQRVLAHRPGLRLLTATEGGGVCRLVRDERPDVVLLDVHLPDLGGAEVLRRLQADPATAQTPVIMVSADATPRRIERLLAAGAQHYLTKPLDVSKFLAVLDEVMGAVRNR
jgi:PAS domain S-box-containing protein